MSIEFRLKYIRDAIDKNVNEVLLKWNARKVLLNESFDEDPKELCPVCMNAGKESCLKYSYVNLDEAIYKCESPACLYPFRNFKYKNFVDRTIFRYERIMETGKSQTEGKIFTSPTKVETDALDEFNISWLDDSYTGDLESIISAPSAGPSCDIKDIINSLCNNQVATPQAQFKSPARSESAYSPQSTAPKLSKCLQHIQHISPTKQTNTNQFKMPSVRRNFASVKSAEVNNVVPAVKAGFKSFKKIPKTKNRDVRPVQSIVEQQPLGFLEWLNVVSKTEPNQIQELKFTSLSEGTERRDLHTNNGDLATCNTVISSEPNNVQPILIELMATPEPLGSDQLQSNTKPCLLYKLDHSTNGQSDAISNSHCDQPTTVQTLGNVSPRHAINIIPTESNVERSTFVSEESTSAVSENINTEMETGSDHGGQDHNATNNGQKKPAKRKPKIDREKFKLERQIKRKLELQAKKKSKLLAQLQLKKDWLKQTKVDVKQKKFCIEAEENFLGFEAVEPFVPIILRKKELVWLRLE